MSSFLLIWFLFVFHLLPVNNVVCEDGGFLLQGQCVATCPESTHATNRTGLTGILPSCVPCHYSCLTCDGPSDSECVSCHADSQLKSVISPGIINQSKNNNNNNNLKGGNNMVKYTNKNKTMISSSLARTWNSNLSFSNLDTCWLMEQDSRAERKSIATHENWPLCWPATNVGLLALN